MFHMSLLNQAITRKKEVKKLIELNIGNDDSKEYKWETI